MATSPIFTIGDIDVTLRQNDEDKIVAELSGARPEDFPKLHAVMEKFLRFEPGHKHLANVTYNVDYSLNPNAHEITIFLGTYPIRYPVKSRQEDMLTGDMKTVSAALRALSDKIPDRQKLLEAAEPIEKEFKAAGAGVRAADEGRATAEAERLLTAPLDAGLAYLSREGVELTPEQAEGFRRAVLDKYIERKTPGRGIF